MKHLERLILVLIVFLVIGCTTKSESLERVYDTACIAAKINMPDNVRREKPGDSSPVCPADKTLTPPHS
jgi:hypothetical protein